MRWRVDRQRGDDPAELPLAGLTLPRAGLIFAIVIATQYGSGSLLDRYVPAFAHLRPEDGLTWAASAEDVCARGIWIVVLVLAVRFIGGIPLRATTIFSFKSGDLALGLLAFVGYLAANQSVEHFEDLAGLGALPSLRPAVPPHAAAVGPRLLFLVTSSLFAPFEEELSLRGVVFGPLSRRFGYRTGTYASAAIFSYLHGSIASAPIYFAGGLILAYIVRRTNRLAASFVAHAATNTSIDVLQVLESFVDRILPEAV